MPDACTAVFGDAYGYRPVYGSTRFGRCGVIEAAIIVGGFCLSFAVSWLLIKRGPRG